MRLPGGAVRSRSSTTRRERIAPGLDIVDQFSAAGPGGTPPDAEIGPHAMRRSPRRAHKTPSAFRATSKPHSGGVRARRRPIACVVTLSRMRQNAGPILAIQPPGSAAPPGAAPRCRAVFLFFRPQGRTRAPDSIGRRHSRSRSKYGDRLQIGLGPRSAFSGARDEAARYADRLRGDHPRRSSSSTRRRTTPWAPAGWLRSKVDGEVTQCRCFVS